jgi:hypothetical protein
MKTIITLPFIDAALVANVFNSETACLTAQVTGYRCIKKYKRKQHDRILP